MPPKNRHKTLQEAQHLLEQAAQMISSVAHHEATRTAYAAQSIKSRDRKSYLIHQSAMELQNLCSQFDEVRRAIRT